MVQSGVARRMAIALICLASFVPQAFADNQVKSHKNGDGSTHWEVIDDDSPDATTHAAPAAAAAAPSTVAPVRASSGRIRQTGNGGAVSVHKNRDGSVEAYCSGPSGVIPAGGFSDNWSSDGGGSAGSQGTSSGGGGVTLTRNADGSIETSSAGPSGSWGGGHASTRRHHPVHKAAHHATAAKKKSK